MHCSKEQITKDEFRNENPVWSPGADELAFFSTRGNQAGIWRVSISGGEPKLVTEIADASVSLRRWSKNNLLYYESKRNLFAVDIDTGQSKQLTNFNSKKINAEAVSISPDERRIAFVSNNGEQWRVQTMPVNNGVEEGEPALTVTSAAEIKNSVWHPDNQRLFYSSPVDGTFQIFVADAAASAPSAAAPPPKQITFGERDSFVLDASADGTKILYGSAKEESDVWAIEPLTLKEYAVASDINSELWANASPDGKTIVYQSIKNLSQGNKLFSGEILAKQINSPSESPVQVVAEGFLPTFSPDGRKIAFIRVSGKKYQLVVSETSGAAAADQKILTTGGIAAVSNTILPYNRIQTSDFAWSPDGAKIAYISDENQLSNIRLVNADSSSVKDNVQMTKNEDSNILLSCPLWSADGKRIAFTTKTDKRNMGGDLTYDVWVMDAETRKVKIVIQRNSFLRLIGWSQTGANLLLASIEARTAASGLQPKISLTEVQTETGDEHEIGVIKDSYLYNIHLSPDKKTIAFVSKQGGNDNIFVMPSSVAAATGGEEKKITGNNDARIYFSSLSWSPDAKTIFFGKQTRYSLLSMLTNFK